MRNKISCSKPPATTNAVLCRSIVYINSKHNSKHNDTCFCSSTLQSTIQQNKVRRNTIRSTWQSICSKVSVPKGHVSRIWESICLALLEVAVEPLRLVVNLDLPPVQRWDMLKEVAKNNGWNVKADVNNYLRRFIPQWAMYGHRRERVEARPFHPIFSRQPSAFE